MANNGAAPAQALGALPKPYTGLRVLDFTNVLAGPSCTRILSDLGAEVIKVEAPDGDRIRFSSPQRDGTSATFSQYNAGKKNICLDLKNPDALEIVKKLAATADILIEAFRPGVAGRLGFGYEIIREIKPDIIYCSISGFGQDGPFSERPAYAPVVHGTSGFDRAQMRDRTGDQPARGTGVLVADMAGGITAYGAIATALYHRLATGEGQYIDCALLDGISQILWCEVQDGQFPDKVGSRLEFPPIKAKDGYVYILPVAQGHFKAMAEVADHPEWITDPRFEAYTTRLGNAAELVELMERWAAEIPCTELEEKLSAAGCPCATVHKMQDFGSHPQVLHREVMTEIEDSAGAVKVVNTPFRFSGMGIGPGKFVSDLGAHNTDLLIELGYSEADIDRLATEGAAPVPTLGSAG